MVKRNFKISKEGRNFFLGAIVGYVIGAMYSLVFIIFLSRIGYIDFIPSITELLLLKIEFTYFPQLVSTIVFPFIGYYYIKNRKISYILIALLLLFFIIYTLFWYIFLVKIIGQISEI
jgi:hypothetical protein